MPNYTYRCDACPRDIVRNRPIAKRDDLLPCDCCGKPLRRLRDAPDFKVRGGTPRFHDKGR